MKHTLYILTLFGFVMVLSCDRSTTQKEKLTEDEKSVVANDVRKMLHEYYKDIKESGLTAEFEYLDNSKDFFWVPPDYSTAISYDSVAAILNQSASMYESIDNRWDTLRIVPLNTELATYTGKLRSTITDTAGQVSQVILAETGLVIKRQKGWKLLCGQTKLLSD